MARTVDTALQRTRARRPLSRERILDAAVSLIERDGPAALSMRRLGAELHVEGMAIYHHLASRDELLRAIAERLLEPLHHVELAEDWREACRRFATALRGVALARPATFRLVGLQPFGTPTSLAPIERLLQVLVAHGFAPADALAVYRALSSYARGYALAEAAGFTIDAATTSGRERLATLSPDEFPVLAGRAAELAELDADGGFDRGLCALLDGLPAPSRRPCWDDVVSRPS